MLRIVNDRASRRMWLKIIPVDSSNTTRF